jgi:hypothetical protein
MIRLAIALIAAAAAAFAEPRIFYSKSFPGSAPPYCEITLEKNGKVVYKESAQDDQPVKFQIAAEEASQIYALAEKLEHFSRKLESGLNVAKMGEKTFRWEDPAKDAGKPSEPAANEVKFNYSMDPDARALQDWFERMTETVQLHLILERSVRFDKLGANKALILVQAAMERNRVVGAEQFLPLLDRVIKNDSYLNMARERAAAIAAGIRAGKPKAE